MVRARTVLKYAGLTALGIGAGTAVGYAWGYNMPISQESLQAAYQTMQNEFVRLPDIRVDDVRISGSYSLGYKSNLFSLVDVEKILRDQAGKALAVGVSVLSGGLTGMYSLTKIFSRREQESQG